jgi:hypothetical protein
MLKYQEEKKGPYNIPIRLNLFSNGRIHRLSGGVRSTTWDGGDRGSWSRGSSYSLRREK